MDLTLKLVGKTSNEIYLLRYPTTLLDFCDFDLSIFAKDSIDLCNEALKSGTLDADRAAELRKDIQNAHCYIRHHIRTTYEKTVLDCWIDYVCRRDNIGDGALWNRFVRCKTPFEKQVFARLCDFRYNRDINHWVNIVRVQEYARTKVNFVFPETAKSVGEVAARRNYFDLAFSVTASELGCRIEDLGVTKIFSAGRIPTAPFMFPNISKEIVRGMLADFDYSDDYSDIGEYSESSDRLAMDAFSRIKESLSQEVSSYSLMRGNLDKHSDKIYMPCSLKAVVDLEIDTMIENGAWLAKCKRCGRYFMKDNEHNEDYCSRFVPNGKTCLEIYEDEHPKPKMTPELEQRCREVTDEIYSRVDKTMSVKEYDYWHNYLEAMKRKVENGEITPDELEDFLDYSLEVDITRSHPIVEVAKKEPEAPKERVVKPFIPERISRSDIPQPPAPEVDPEEERVMREGFFTSPSKERRKGERPQISHIIRGGESLGESYDKRPDPSGFQPFGQLAPSEPARREQPAPQEHAQREYAQREQAPRRQPVRREPEQRSPYEDLKRLEEQRMEAEKRLREMTERPAPRPFGASEDDQSAFRPFGEPEPQRRRTPRAETHRAETQRAETQRVETQRAEPERIARSERPLVGEFVDYTGELDERPRGPRMAPRSEPTFTEEYDDREYKAVAEPVSQPEQLEPPPPPKPRVIRKNAAAISAYGKMAGASVSAAPPEIDVVSEPPTLDLTDIAPQRDPVREAPQISNSRRDASRLDGNRSDGSLLDEDPFKDIESIFDVLEQSEDELTQRPRRSRSRRETAREEEKPPRRVTKENAPSGIWTEDRDVYGEQPDEPEQSELDMLKEKKHGKSNKTRRLYDVIMREPDDNPNFRR
ncbi:MAG: hypothetical protein K2N38_10575 [Oscillospiraceae bacterium]|nr:hypothetical protein [Oscillospiraceae bacterium]